ncbi:DUF7848 domain-containing protein [Streptomyces hydrogenans]|uniref:DUF7848 domain-containing protein n=1 Tax=Streptomyces hydrogenans TaxID=1873719 RepID=UPI004062EAA2
MVSTRAVYRFETHRLQRHPDSVTSVSFRCLRPACAWSVGPTEDADKASDDCIRHAAETKHRLFASTAEDIAAVVPVK